MTKNSIDGHFYDIQSNTTNHLLLCLILLIYYSNLSLVLADPYQVKANLLDGAGFQLEAKVQFWPENFANPPRSMKVSSVEFFETYSTNTKRAKIVQRLRGRSPRKYFLAEGELNLIKLAAQRDPDHETDLMKCEQIKRNNLIDDLFEVEGGSGELATNWLTNLADTQPHDYPDYFLGMARLLLVFDSNRDRLKPIRDMQRIREMQCQRYDLEWRIGQLDLILSVYLGDNTLTWNGAALPLRIWVKTRTRGLMMVDFYSIRALPERPRLEQLNYFIDPTTVDLGFGCSSNSTKEQSYPTFHEVYSMHSEMIDNRNVSIRREFVAFDGRQQAFRRESISPNEYGFRETITIYDLKHDIKFIKRPVPMMSHDAIGTTKSSSKCIGAPTWLTGGRPFMPFDKFVRMGTGIVRGMEVVILEHISKKPPEIFLPAARYLNLGNDQIQSSFVDTLASSFNRVGPFSVVYYFGPHDSPKDKLALGRLIRVDLMANGRLLVQINVYKFMWQLTDAPNGDRKELLFRVPRSCCDEWSSTTASRSLELELEYQAATSSRITEQVALSLVESVPVRSMGLLRGLSEQVEDISITRLTNIVSVLRQSSGQHFKIFVNIELAFGQQISLPLQPVLATRVTIINGQKPISDATSFEECFYEAALKYGLNQREVLFAFIEDALCFIDSNPIYETSKQEDGSTQIKFTYSNVFRFSRSITSSYPAMRITQVDIEKILNEFKPRRIATKIVSDLTNRRLIMPVVDSRNPDLLLESLVFKIETISITDQQSRSDQQKPNLLQGLALINAKVLQKNSETGVVDQQSCQAACFSDLNCRSYSICARDHAVDCRISEIDFDDENLSIQLDRKRKEATEAKRHQINLDYQPTTIKDQEIESLKPATKHVELLVDKRCQIYKNRAIDMFDEVSRAMTRVELDQLVQVDNKEECARLCLEENINYFKKYQNISLIDSKTLDTESIKKHYAKSLKEWCSTFRYTDLKTSTRFSEALTEFQKDGLCQYSRGLRERSSERVLNATMPTSVEMDIFEFNHVNLYAVQPNVVMKPYYPDSDSPHEPTNRRRLFHMTTLEDCARACFSQVTGLIPYCKSFEYAIVKVPTSGVMEESTRVSAISQCAFNTMSIDDAIASDHYDRIVEIGHDPSIESTNHYEPLKAYWVDSKFMSILTRDPIQQIGCDRVRLSDTLLGLFIITIALISGLYIGVRLERPVLEYWTIFKEKAKMRRFQRFSGESS